ncbi:hypothetical protein LCGC14_1018470 [marine sediment metagenome]|uniref:Uncharacterized protein n=1 Tax=marine sediment metagenome TaxID=412755 RepID=A0A0F9MY23_9ZZZZ
MNITREIPKAANPIVRRLIGVNLPPAELWHGDIKLRSGTKTEEHWCPMGFHPDAKIGWPSTPAEMNGRWPARAMDFFCAWWDEQYNAKDALRALRKRMRELMAA